MSSSCRRIIAVRIPRRRWVGRTPTQVTPSIGVVRPPGRVRSNGNAPADATMRPPSNTARLRSAWNAMRSCSMSLSSRWLPKAIPVVRKKAGASSSVTGRISKSAEMAISAVWPSGGGRAADFSDQLDPLLGAVGVAPLLVQQRGPVGLRFGCRLGIGLGQRRLNPLVDDELGPLPQFLDHSVLGDDRHVVALDEQVTLLAAGGDAEVGVAGLARTVHDAAHDGDLQ